MDAMQRDYGKFTAPLEIYRKVLRIEGKVRF